jgi:hypothetical protein
LFRERSLSVTITRGTVRLFFIILRKKRLAAALSRAALHQDVQDVAVLVDGPPQVLQPPVNLDEDLVQVPLVPRPRLSAAQRACVGLPELGAPAADRLVGDDDPALERQLLDLAERQREAEVQPHAMGDDLDRVPVTLVRQRRAPHGRPFPG